jgi:hypothetical protein
MLLAALAFAISAVAGMGGGHSTRDGVLFALGALGAVMSAACATAWFFA